MKALFIKKEHVTGDIWTYWFESEKPYSYQAGQALEVTLAHDKADSRGERRWLTLSSSPTEQLLAITVKINEKGSSYKQKLHRLKQGETITLSPPVGDFVLPKQATRPLVFVAAGVGIAPLRSMVKFLHDNKEHREIYLHYAARRTKDFAYVELFQQYCTNLELYPSQETKPRRMSGSRIIKSLDDSVAEQGWFFIAGPELFVIDLKRQLELQGIKQRRIVTDPYHGYEKTSN